MVHLAPNLQVKPTTQRREPTSTLRERTSVQNSRGRTSVVRYAISSSDGPGENPGNVSLISGKPIVPESTSLTICR